MRAWKGVERARAEGFRVRFAATVSTDQEVEEFRGFLDAHVISEEDRVIRRSLDAVEQAYQEAVQGVSI